jgi:hypothetical protein
MANIKNNSDLTFHFRVIAEKVIENVSKIVVDELKFWINLQVYDAAQREKERDWYVDYTKEPTYEFREAFHFDEITKSANTVITKLFYDWATMSVGTTGEKGNYIHTQNGDFRQFMAEAFNVDDFVEGDFKDRKREPYWDTFISTMFASSGASDSLSAYFASELARYGFHKI